MALVRCTCLYDAAPTGSAEGPLVVVAADPWCPAEDVHRRTAAAPAPEPADPQR